MSQFDIYVDCYVGGVDAATRIRTARTTERLTQAELAARAGTTQSAIAAYENGSRSPSAKTLRRLLDVSGFRPSHVLAERRTEICRLIERYRGRDVRVFGSVARGDDSFESDIDLLVTFERGTSLLDLVGLEDELRDMLGVDVDIVSSGGLRVPKHQAVLDEARPL